MTDRAHPYGHCTITGPAEDVAFIFRHLPDIEEANVQPKGTAVAAGWTFTVTEDESESWLRVTGPGGQEIAFSAERGSVRAQVMQELAIAQAPAPGAERFVSADTLARLAESPEGTDLNQPGSYYRNGWNAALRLAMDYAQPLSASPAVKDGPTVRDSDKQLMGFYSVESLPALIDAQEEHVRRLQAKLPSINQPAFTRVREG